jgi:hypothetical protein
MPLVEPVTMADFCFSMAVPLESMECSVATGSAAGIEREFGRQG